MVEGPYAFIDPDDGPSIGGFGDVAIAPRLMLVDFSEFLLSLNLEVEIPSGSASKGLGAGETIFGPSLSGWIDFGNWITGSFQVGAEQGLESGDTELIYRGALALSFLGPALVRDAKSTPHAHHSRYPLGLVSLTAELDGRTPFSGEDSGVSTAEAIIGITYSVTDSLDVRGAYTFPVFKPKELDNGWIAGLVYHF